MKKVCILSLILSVMCQKTPACPDNKVIFGNACLDQCPDGYITIQNKNSLRCKECPLDQFLVPNKSKKACVCANNYYKQGGLCLPCHYTCGDCNGGGPNECTKCDRKTNRLQSDSSCVCLPGFWQDTESMAYNCLPCHKECGTCNGPEDTDCITCGHGRVKNKDNYCICSNNFVPDKNGVCVCPSGNFISKDGQCTQIVVEDYSTEDIGGLITNIESNNQRKQNGRQDASECLPGQYLIKGVCGFCGENEEYDPTKSKCKCIDEANKFDGRCIVCREKQKFSKKDGECVCSKNEEKDENGDCVKCPRRETYKIGQGCTCIFNYYRRRQNKICRPCKSIFDDPNCAFESQRLEDEYLVLKKYH